MLQSKKPYTVLFYSTRSRSTSLFGYFHICFQRRHSLPTVFYNPPYVRGFSPALEILFFWIGRPTHTPVVLSHETAKLARGQAIRNIQGHFKKLKLCITAIQFRILCLCDEGKDLFFLFYLLYLQYSRKTDISVRKWLGSRKLWGHLQTIIPCAN